MNSTDSMVLVFLSSIALCTVFWFILTTLIH